VNDQFPSSDDRPLWDLHLSALTFPSLTAADDLGIFEALAEAPATADELSTKLQLNRRGMRALLPVLASAGLIVQRLGRYYLGEPARNFLLRSSPFYWGPVLALIRQAPMTHRDVVGALQAPDVTSRWDVLVGDRPSGAWSEGRIAPEVARAIAAYMQANCAPAALAAAECVDLNSTTRLLDVGAGSGAFSIAFARSNPSLNCTMMDLSEMCEVALNYVRKAGVAHRIDARAVDMFREAWPGGYDAIFLSNILHDWDFETCAALAGKAYAALPSGGRILLHEMLLDDTHDGPATAVAFSMYMLLGTKGQQFTAAELSKLLTDAGFEGVDITPTHGYYAVVSASKL
jgi:O-methyltransferase domain/Dimerisation domain